MATGISVKNVVITAAVVLVVGLLVGLFIKMRLDNKAEEARRIAAQNRVAELSTVIQENEHTWSRLTQQKDDLITALRQQNGGLAQMIEDREEHILALSNVVLSLRSAHIVIRSQDGGNVHETPVPSPDGERLRVDFDQTQDPIRVSGFTLTNPAEASIDVGFVRPLRLTLSVVQQRDLSWRTYVVGDYPGLNIDSIEAAVSPWAREPEGRAWYENIVLGMNIATTPKLSAMSSNLYVLYDFDTFAVGPTVGVSVADGVGTFYAIGATLQFRPF